MLPWLKAKETTYFQKTDFLDQWPERSKDSHTELNRIGDHIDIIKINICKKKIQLIPIYSEVDHFFYFTKMIVL